MSGKARPDALTRAILQVHPELAGRVHLVNGRPWCDGVNHTTMCSAEFEAPQEEAPDTCPLCVSQPCICRCHQAGAVIDIPSCWGAEHYFVKESDGVRVCQVCGEADR